MFNNLDDLGKKYRTQLKAATKLSGQQFHSYRELVLMMWSDAGVDG